MHILILGKGSLYLGVGAGESRNLEEGAGELLGVAAGESRLLGMGTGELLGVGESRPLGTGAGESRHMDMGVGEFRCDPPLGVLLSGELQGDSSRPFSKWEKLGAGVWMEGFGSK
jgi:hypothetical protein